MRESPAVHPGERLREQFMRPFGLTAYRLAKDLRVPVTRIQAIISERRGISGDTALRLARYFVTTPEFWLDMQRDFDLQQAAAALGDRLAEEVKPRAQDEINPSAGPEPSLDSLAIARPPSRKCKAADPVAKRGRKGNAQE
jgi:addiction module HigA family antidote